MTRPIFNLIALKNVNFDGRLVVPQGTLGSALRPITTRGKVIGYWVRWQNGASLAHYCIEEGAGWQRLLSPVVERGVC